VSGSRSARRRAQIRATATELFAQHGYHNVSVTDIGDSLGISASALYYHFDDKQDLLLDAILDVVDRIDALIHEASGLDDALASFTTFAVGARDQLVVWERESRHLEGAQREALRKRGMQLAAAFVPLLRAERPQLTAADAEVLAWALLGVVGSRARHRLSISTRRDQELFFRLARVASTCELSPPVSRPPDDRSGRTFDTRVRRSRRTQLLNAAIRLFDERGYQSVTMADIGAAAGIVASGVYRHFPSKTDILVAAVNRGTELMQMRTEQALAAATTPELALESILRTHIAVVVEGSNLIGIAAQERDQLPEKERTLLRRRQADYLDTWVDILREVHPDRGTTELKMVIHAVHAMVYVVARAGRDATWPHAEQRLRDIGMALLTSGLPAGP
jgi:AcrR family transcriptional regulator